MSIVYRQRALADLESIFDYVSRDNPDAARKVVARIVQSLLRLDKFPFSGRAGLKDGTRELSVSGLPYFAVYKVIEERDQALVEIVAVYHTAQVERLTTTEPFPADKILFRNVGRTPAHRIRWQASYVRACLVLRASNNPSWPPISAPSIASI